MEKAAFVFVLKEVQIFEISFSFWFFFNSPEHHVSSTLDFCIFDSYQNEEEKKINALFLGLCETKQENKSSYNHCSGFICFRPAASFNFFAFLPVRQSQATIWVIMQDDRSQTFTERKDTDLFTTHYGFGIEHRICYTRAK